MNSRRKHNLDVKQNGLDIILNNSFERCDKCGKKIVKNERAILMTKPTRYFCNEYCYSEYKYAKNRLERFLDSLAVFN